MLSQMAQRFHDMRTVLALCQEAERQALSAGQAQPGSEHFLLAAIELPDGTAREAFSKISADPAQLRSAITDQYTRALAHVGIVPAVAEAVLSERSPLARRTLPPQAQPSGIELLTRLSERQERLPKNAPLSGALVVAAVAQERHSVAARALQAMRIDATQLADAALAVVKGAMSDEN